jgi:RNA polymerase sigma factor (sigma-70 family)
MLNREQIIEKHYRNNRDKLVKRVLNRVPNRSEALAEECVQEAYFKAYKYFGTFNPAIKEFNSWFNTILNNTVRFCKLQERIGSYAVDIDNMADNLKIEDQDRELLALIYKAIDGESERSKEILTLFYISGFKSREVAEYTGKGHSNVRQIILQFRRKLYSEISD